MTNSKRTIINLITSIGSQLLILVLGLVVPRIVLVHYGSDTNGLTSTISQIFTYMALLQAGISASANNALYKPVTQCDRNGISYYMSAAQRYYRRISKYYFVAVVVLSFLLPIMLKTRVGYWTVAFYVFFEGLASVVTFYFLNSWKCLLNTSGKNYVVTLISFISKILSYFVRILLSLYGVNIALIQVGYFFLSMIELLCYARFMRKHYAWVDYHAAPKNVKLPDRNSYILTEIAWTVFSSTDMIVLSVFVSTALSSVYSVYNMVFVAVNGMLNAAYASVLYNLGHAYAKGMDAYKPVHDLFHSLFLSTMTVLMCVTYVLVLPFVSLYTRNITDITYIYTYLPLLFCLVQLLSWSRYVAGNLSGLAGYAKQTSYVSLIEAMINLVLSVLLVRRFGITGVLLATVAALPIKVIYLNWLAERKIMKRSPKKTITTIGVNFLIFGLTVVVCNFIDLQINSYFRFFVCGFIFTVVFSVLVFGINCVINNNLLKLPQLLKHNHSNEEGTV